LASSTQLTATQPAVRYNPWTTLDQCSAVSQVPPLVSCDKYYYFRSPLTYLISDHKRTRQTGLPRNTALCTFVHRAVNKLK